MQNELLDVNEVARRLSLTAHAVRSMVSRGELECVRLGKRKLRFEPAALERFVAARTRRSGGQPAHGEAGESRRLRNGLAALVDEHDLPPAFVACVAQLLQESADEGAPELVGKDGELWWTPRGLAHALGLVQLFGSEESAVARLAAWRGRRIGPPFVKLGSLQQSPILYEVAAARRWFAAQGVECAPEVAELALVRSTPRATLRHSAPTMEASL